MTNEWEELKRLSKEELIIELVRERTAHRELDRARIDRSGFSGGPEAAYFL